MLMTEVKCSWCDFEFLENEEELALSCMQCGKEDYLMDLGVIEV